MTVPRGRRDGEAHPARGGRFYADGAFHRPLIRIEGLSKRFGYRVALREVTTSVAEGEIRLIVGPNGAGKTTLLRILATLSRPTAGRVTLDGVDLLEDPEEVRSRIGVVLHEPLLYPELTCLENLEFYASLYGADAGACRPALDLVGLLARANDPVATLSMGMRKRLAFARATLHGPRVLLLDEPLAGLDLDGARVVKEFLRGLREARKTILMSSHQVERSWDLADRVTALHNGRAILETDVEAGGLPEFLRAFEAQVGGR